MTPDCPMSPEDNDSTELTCKWMGCGLNFDTLEELVSHLTASHVTSQHGAFYCLWRGCTRTKGFNARYKMLIHIRTHTNERPYVCSECDKRFSRQENLRIHARTHTGEKPYVCNVPGCGKAYSNSSDRFKHTRTHFVDKPYECRHPGCGKRYTDPSSLRKHVKIYGHSKRQEEVNSSTHYPLSNSMGVPESVEQALASARLDLSPSPSSSGSSLGPSPVPSNPSPALLGSSLFHSAAASSAAAVAVSAASLGAVGLSPWAPVTATANFGAVTAAAAWTVALHQYQAGLLLSSGTGLGRGLSFRDHILEGVEEEDSDDETPTTSALDLSICSAPLDLSLPSSRSRKQ